MLFLVVSDYQEVPRKAQRKRKRNAPLRKRKLLLAQQERPAMGLVTSPRRTKQTVTLVVDRAEGARIGPGDQGRQ